ncbi:MAG: cupin domain-containing protein [Alphaproteobacteria bacterium]|nr:cupin domain-containing protein [Alphaproteobacteria bacterium]
MTKSPPHATRLAQIVLPAAALDETLAFFTSRLGFRVAAIFPADSPATVVLAGHGLAIRLERRGQGAPGVIRLPCADPAAIGSGTTTLYAPNGTRIDLVPLETPVAIPPLDARVVVSRAEGGAEWGTGRAGMRYRDLIPGRLGGRFIASHIAIPGGGPVPDYVHFHKVRFQMIYCRKGWVRVVYEDQGPPFVMNAGDCVLQPPEIRHRVLESSPGLEVIEVGCPALHETLADPDMTLPNGVVDPSRDFGGQRFVRHEVAKATWRPWRWAGFDCRDIGMTAATDGLAGVHVVRPAGAAEVPRWRHDGEFFFMVVLEGGTTLQVDGAAESRLAPGDSFTVPAGTVHALRDCTRDLELLEVTLPAGIGAARA